MMDRLNDCGGNKLFVFHIIISYKLSEMPMALSFVRIASILFHNYNDVCKEKDEKYLRDFFFFL